MASLEAFLAMGGYAAFVWPAYLLAAAVLLGLFLVSRGELRQRQRRLAELEASRPDQGRPRRRGARP